MEREKKSLKKGSDGEGKRSLEDTEGAKKSGRRDGVKKDTEITQVTRSRGRILTQGRRECFASNLRTS